MFTLPVVYEKHQVGMHINSSQLRFGKNIAQLLKSLFLFLGTNWSVRGTNTDPGQLCGGQVSGCHSVILFEELFCQKKEKKSLQLTNFHVCLLQTNEGEVPAVFSDHSQTSPKLLSVQYISVNFYWASFIYLCNSVVLKLWHGQVRKNKYRFADATAHFI